jgi:hypothetical protein
MKDIFKIHQIEMVDKGGLDCPCCNSYRGKNSTKKRQIMNKRVRSVLKQELQKEVKFTE